MERAYEQKYARQIQEIERARIMMAHLTLDVVIPQSSYHPVVRDEAPFLSELL